MDKDVKKALKEFGWTYVREGGNHSIYEHPAHGRMPVKASKLYYRAKNNLLRDLEHGPQRPYDKTGEDEEPAIPSSPFDFMPAKEIMTLLDVTSGMLSQATTGVTHTASGYTLSRVEATPELLMKYKASAHTKFFYFVDDTPENRKLLHERGFDVEPPEEQEESYDAPTYKVADSGTELEVDWQAKAAELKELFEEACRESEELREKLKDAPQDTDLNSLRADIRELNERLEREDKAKREAQSKLETAREHLGEHKKKIEMLKKTLESRLARNDELQARVDELEAENRLLNKTGHAPAVEQGSAQHKLEELRRKLTEKAVDDPSLYKLLYETFA